MELMRWQGRVRLGIAAALACAFIFGIPAIAARAVNQDTAPKQSITLAQYEDELDRIANAFSDLPAHPGGADALRQSIPAGWIVDAGEEKFEVSTNWIASTLAEAEKNPKDRKDICEATVKQLKSAREEADRAVGGVPDQNRADARTKLEQILRQREYGKVAGETWWSQVWAQIDRWIDWLLRHTLGRLLGEGTAKKVVIYAIIVVVFLWAAVWLVRGMRTLVRNESLRVDAVFPAGKHWRDWTRQAMDAASRGDYRAALHSAYWAGVYRMAELGAWQLDRARTPREYLRLMGERAKIEPAEQSSAGRAMALKELTHGMEASWYGFLPATEQDFDKAVTHLETLGCRFHSTAQTAKS